MSLLKRFGPVAPRATLFEICRAGIGAGLALLFLDLVFLDPAIDLKTGLFMAAPLGATAVLIFAAPNSPLAQPWSVIVGNFVASLIGVTIGLLIPDSHYALAVAVAVAIVVLSLLRALHPPAGAVAMMAAMSHDVLDNLGYWFSLTPILLGSIALVLLGMVYAPLTGRRYPLRQFDDHSKHKTEDRNPIERLGLTESDLLSILKRYRQSYNMGAEDLSRVIGAAQMQAAAHASGETVAQDFMSTGLIWAKPDSTLIDVAQVFQKHKFTSLPVADENGVYLGTIFQFHVISALSKHAQEKAASPLVAVDIMSETVPVAGPLTPIGALLPMVADGDIDGVPILQGDKLVGIVTRTDLIATLARALALKEVQAAD